MQRRRHYHGWRGHVHGRPGPPSSCATIYGARNASVIFVGFAAVGTLARQIIDGARSVNLFGEDIPVRARIHTINGFSAHADQQELHRLAPQDSG